MVPLVKGHDKVLELLNDVLTAELTAINQYFIHAKMCGDWGFKSLHDKVRAESIDEMRHAEDIIERILYLEGIPNLQRLAKVSVGETVKEQFELDLAMEYDAVERFNNAIKACVDVGDNGTREILEGMLRSEEEHVDWLETQLNLIKTIGEQSYLSEQLG